MCRPVCRYALAVSTGDRLFCYALAAPGMAFLIGSIEDSMRVLIAISLNLLGLPALAEDIAPMALNGFTAPPLQIASAAVYRQDGTALGNVQAVDRSVDAVEGLRIGVVGRRTITLPASDASYDAVKNEVVTDTTALDAALGKN